jgi:hypothetical protein
MNDLNKQKGRAHLGQAVAETQDEPPSDVHVVAVGSTADDTSDDHETTPDDDGDSTAEVVGNVGTGGRC